MAKPTPTPPPDTEHDTKILEAVINALQPFAQPGTVVNRANVVVATQELSASAARMAAKLNAIGAVFRM